MAVVLPPPVCDIFRGGSTTATPTLWQCNCHPNAGLFQRAVRESVARCPEQLWQMISKPSDIISRTTVLQRPTACGLWNCGLALPRQSLAVEERHLNNVGTVQGGAIFTLADFAFGAASKTGGKVAVAISTNLSFLQPTRSGRLYAEATEVSRSRKLSVCSVRVTNDAGELVALFQGTAYIRE